MAEATHHISIADEKNFEFTAKLRNRIFTAFAVGLLMFIVGIVLLSLGFGEEAHEQHAMVGGGGAEEAHEEGDGYHWSKRVFANLWLDSVLFTGISLIGVFFVAVNYLAQAGWSVALRRVPETFGYFLPFTGTALLLLFLFAGGSLFHWTDPELYNPESHHYDPVVVGKSGYLNIPFYVGRMIFYFVAWFILFLILRRNSVKEDSLTKQTYKADSIKLYNTNVYMGAVFIAIFAVTSSMAAWDWVMSIDVHWFSTMFGWYCFASWFVSGLATITLTVILLKEQGYLKVINESHLHDLGKFMFAFSIFWTYIWFSQFMLYYYANISEETIYFIERLTLNGSIYRPVFFVNILINFAFPFLILMTRNAKRKMLLLKIVAIAILIGHWLDFYMMVMPGTVGQHGGFGLVEFGCLLMFVSAFIYVVSMNLAKANLIPKNDPFLKESINHTIA